MDSKLLTLIEGIFDEIKHGDAEHQAWLKTWHEDFTLRSKDSINGIWHLEKKLETALAALKFYADNENWTRRDSIFWENIDRDDCKDYPHFTRDIRLTGGHRARAALAKIKEMENEE